MNPICLILLIGIFAPQSCHALDFWLTGSLPAEHTTYTGEARFKLTLHSAIDKQPVSRTDPLGNQSLQVVNGRFTAKLKTPSGKEGDLVLKTDFSKDGKVFVSLPDVRLVIVHLHLDKGTQGRLLGPTIVDPCEDKSEIAIVPGEKYIFCMQQRSSAGGVSYFKSGSFSIDDGSSLFSEPSVFTTASLTIRENETKYWATRAPVELRANGKPTLGPEKAVITPPSLVMKQASADQYGSERNWTDTKGRKLMAAFVWSDSTTVIVKTSAGMMQLLSVDQLSPLDQEYLQKTADP